MSRARDFFTPTQREQIKSAIVEAEKLTSGEIRVHVENNVLIDVLDRAAYVFEQLGMHKTKYRNAVLIYLAVKDGQFAILGDVGIHQHVGDEYWNSTRDQMRTDFNEAEFTSGIEKAILDIGEKLKKFFPIDLDDVNELSNQISDDISMNEN